MNESKRNIVLSTWSKDDISRLNLDKTKQINNLNSRFPHITYIKNIKEVNRKEGFILIAPLDEFPCINEYIEYMNEKHYKSTEPNIDFYEFDRLYRRKFKRFEYVIIISIDHYDFLRPKKIPYSNIIFYDEPSFNKDENIIYNLYQEYLNNKDKTFSNIKLKNIKRLYEYLHNNKKDFYTTKEIMTSLKVSDKWVKRYMKHMNYLYNNVGYNPRIKKWYITK